MCSSDDSFTLPPTCLYNSCLDMMAPSAPHLLHTIRISIIIPVYNEGQFIEEVLCRVQAVNLKNKFQIEKELIVVDDGSVDGTREWLIEMQERQATGFSEAEVQGGKAKLRLDNIRFLFQRQNRGKGAALRLGFAEASGSIVLIQDADLELDPQDYPKLLEPILAGRADVVYGSRFLGEPHQASYSIHYLGNRFLTGLSNLFTNMNISDMETCYKVFRREILTGIRLQSDRFGFEPEFTAEIARRKWRLCEVPVSYMSRTYKGGKKINWRDGLETIWCILRFNLLR
jgi:glycosyltransferase involved in cell wall biosynthesis